MIELLTFGSLELFDADGEPIRRVVAQPKRFALLTYLALARPRGYRRRDELLAVFWPDRGSSAARNALSRSLHFLRSHLPGGLLTSRGVEEIGVDPQVLDADVVRFEEALAREDPEEALSLYRGPFLDAFHLPAAPPFEDWVSAERGRLRRRAARAGWDLAHDLIDGGRSMEAERVARTALARAPTDESAVRKFICALAPNDRAAALDFYEAFVASLAAELDLEPGAETVAVAQKVRDGTFAAPTPEGGTRSPAGRPTASVSSPGASSADESSTSGAEAMGPGSDPTSLPESQAAAPDPVPAGRRRVLAPLAALIVLLLGIVGGISLRDSDPPSPPRLGPASIAVLPFVSATPEGERFAAGLHSEVLTQLQKLGSLEVSGHTSVLRYEGTEKTVPRIAEELGVATVMEATVFRDENRYRLNVRLLDGATGRQLRARAYEGDLTVPQLFEAQEEIALRVAGALDVALASGEMARLADRPTTNEAAYDHYLQGQSHFGRGRLDRATAAYGRAVEEDSAFASAWVGLSRSSALDYFLSGGRGNRARAEEALKRARELAPDAPGTHLAAGVASLYLLGRYDDAIDHFRSVTELRPGAVQPLVYSTFAHILALRLDDAERLVARVLRRDPLNDWALYQAGFLRARRWRFREAAPYFDRAIALEPDAHFVFNQRWDLYMWGLGDTARARAILEDAPATIPTTKRRLRLAYVQRDTARMETLLQEGDLASTDRYGWLARLHRLRGEPELRRLYGDSMRTAARTDLSRARERGVPRWLLEAERSRLGVAQALAGDRKEAVRTVEVAVARVEGQPDRLNRLPTYYHEVLTYVFLGDTNTAIQRLDSLFSEETPRLLTPARLRLDPDFQVLLNDRRFEAMLEKLETSSAASVAARQEL